MDIYKFINSRDIREHCRKLGHQFNTVESAYLVWQSRDTPLTEKHAAWQEIIARLPDINWCHNGKDWGSIHRCLERYMELEDRLVEDFITADELQPCEGTYSSSIDMMYNSIQLLAGDKGVDKIEHSDWYKDMSEHYIIKDPDIWISHGERNLQVNYVVKSNVYKDTFACINMGSSKKVLNQEEVEFMKLFESMWLYVPTPFQTGDLVTSEDGPAVLYDWKMTPENTEYIRRMEWEGAKCDMYCSTYDMAKDSFIVRSGTEFYLGLEYYQGEVPPEKRLLIALSGYCKSEIILPVLLEAHGLYQKAFDFIKEHRNMCDVYAKAAQERMGIGSIRLDAD